MARRVPTPDGPPPVGDETARRHWTERMASARRLLRRGNDDSLWVAWQRLDGQDVPLREKIEDFDRICEARRG